MLFQSFSSKFLRGLTSLAAIVASFSVSYTHSHAAPQDLSHGPGWSNRDIPGDFQSQRHRHRVLFGMEGPAETPSDHAPVDADMATIMNHPDYKGDVRAWPGVLSVRFDVGSLSQAGFSGDSPERSRAIPLSHSAQRRCSGVARR